MPLLHIGGCEWLDWHLHLDVIIWLVLLEGVYLYAVTYLRPVISDAGRIKRSQILTFSAGVLVLYVGAGSPIHDLSEKYLASVHMFQHLLFTLAAPPLLLLGTPSWLLQPLLRSAGAARLLRLATRPVFTFALFNALLLVTHLPPVVDLALNVHAFHFFVHVLLVTAALLMWWPILSPVRELPRISYPMQMGYLFLQSLLPSVMASFITFSDRVVYPFYAKAPRIWGIGPLADQQIAGVMMKLLGSLILWSAMGVVFYKWYEQHEREEREAISGLKWDEVEEELDRLGLTNQRK